MSVSKKQEEFEDTKGANRIRISKKNRQPNGQKKKYKNCPRQPCFILSDQDEKRHTCRRHTIVPLLIVQVQEHRRPVGIE